MRSGWDGALSGCALRDLQHLVHPSLVLSLPHLQNGHGDTFLPELLEGAVSRYAM